MRSRSCDSETKMSLSFRTRLQVGDDNYFVLHDIGVAFLRRVFHS
jgi:hypothetical protein